jgi:hypothetical protein
MTSEVVEELTERYRLRSVRKSTEIFLRVPDAVSMQEDAERLGLAALGFEGFELLSDGVRPRLDWIADFSPQASGRAWSEYQSMVNADARRFLAEIPQELAVIPLYWSKQEYELGGYGARHA